MTKVPKPTSWTAHYDLKYDAWNRLTEVKDGASTVATYEYDGLNRRIVKTVGSDVEHYYYNTNWQLLEVRSGSETGTVIEAYIWHPRYVDALAARFWDSNADGDFADTDEVQYALHDANYNVTALVDTTGAVIERYEYTPYGEVTVLDADFSDDADGVSDVENPYTYTGRRFDDETGLYYYRNRYYHAELGRFVSRDPLAYWGSKWNLYEYTSSIPTTRLDPYGLEDLIAGAGERPYADAGIEAGNTWLNAIIEMFGFGTTVDAIEYVTAQDFTDPNIRPLSAEEQAQAGASAATGIVLAGLPVVGAAKPLTRIQRARSAARRTNGANALRMLSLVDQLDLPSNTQRALLREAMESAGTGKVAHHLIPLEAVSKHRQLLEKAAEGGFNINGRNNGVLLREGVDHIYNHPIYNRDVLDHLESIPKDLTPKETARRLQRAQPVLRASLPLRRELERVLVDVFSVGISTFDFTLNAMLVECFPLVAEVDAS